MILRYSKPGGTGLLDQFSGSGTTLVEAKLLNRNAVGVDINPQSVSLSRRKIFKFKCETQSRIFVRKGDATDLSFIKDEKIDFICHTHHMLTLFNTVPILMGIYHCWMTRIY